MNMRSYNCCLVKSLKSEKISVISAILKIIAEENRLKILCLLKEKSHCVCDMIAHLKLSQSLISHHLKDLKDIDLVKAEKKGIKVYYSLTKKGKKIISLLFKI